jgi:aryl-alcohol dehydrogenase-like predicted oxidoreductase
LQYRTIGNTGLSISEIGFGTGGTAGLMIKGTREEQRDAVKRALDLGINYFDESPDYGNGVSESNLGSLLKELGVRPVITTKVEVRAGDLGDIAGHIERSVEQSLRRLQVDYVDIVQIHNGPVARRPDLQGRDYRILALDDYLRPGGAIEGLDRILKAGKARYVGFICRGDDGPEVKQLLDTARFHLINLVYTLLNPTASGIQAEAGASPDFGGVIDYARDRGVGVAVYSPLAGGLLSDHALAGGEPHRLSQRFGGASAGSVTEARTRAMAQASRFAFLSQPGSHSLAQAAVRFILMHPGVTTVLGGFSDIPQLEEVCAAADLPSLDDDAISRIEAAWLSNRPVS